MLVAFPVLLSGCNKDELPQEQVEIPTGWRSIEAGTWSFRFPINVELLGKDDVCGGRDAPKEGCSIAIEGPVYRAATADFTLQTLDPYGDRGPSDWGHPLRLNGSIVYRQKDAVEESYVVTDRSGGKGKAVRFSNPNIQAGTQNDPAEQPLLWMSCRSAQGCATARAVAASVRFEDISQYCPPTERESAPRVFPQCPDHRP